MQKALIHFGGTLHQVFLLGQFHERQTHFKILINLFQCKSGALFINLGHVFFNIFTHEGEIVRGRLNGFNLGLFHFNLRF